MRSKAVIAILYCLFVFLGNSLKAQETPTVVKYQGTSTKFATMVGDRLHYQAAIYTAQQLNIKENHYDFTIVAVGILAKELADNKEMKADIELAEKTGVKTVVCENALRIFKASKETLDKRIKTTPNAWIYMFELKDKGYNTLNN